MSDITRLGLLGVSLLGLGSLFFKKSNVHTNPLPAKIMGVTDLDSRKSALKAGEKILPYIKALYHAQGLPLKDVASFFDVTEDELRSFIAFFESESLRIVIRSVSESGISGFSDASVYMHIIDAFPTNDERYEFFENLVQEALTKGKDPVMYITEKYPPATPEIVRLCLKGTGIFLQKGADYRMMHKAPDAANAPLFDVTLGGCYPKDFYEKPRYYVFEASEWSAYNIITRMRNFPNHPITIYRAVPPEVSKINRGDWVTLNRGYAKEHLLASLQGKGKIISKKVLAREVFTDGNSLFEWGYWPENY